MADLPTSNKKLIVNADDFGRTHGINLGVLESFNNGIVTSATIMINMPFAQEAIQISAIHQIPLGLHLNITSGEFFTGSNYLFGDKGKVKNMYKNGGALTSKDMGLIIKEYEAQIAKFFKITQKMPSHLDHHHNVQKISGYLKPYIDFIASLKIPTRTRSHTTRVKRPDFIIESFFSEKELTKAHLMNIISSLKNGVSELITHPSLITGESLDSYTENPRYKQMKLLTDPEIKQAVGKAGVRLIS